MTLRDWLLSIDKSPDWLAEEVGVSGHTVRRWIVGDHRPLELDHYRIIERLSEGRVTAADILLRPATKRAYKKAPRPAKAVRRRPKAKAKKTPMQR